MRDVVGIFGLMCGLVVIGLVGRYGYKTTDNEADAWIMAFLFGAIAAGGLFGHAVAVRLWSYSKVASMGMGLVSVGALGLNLSNSLGAIAGRSDQVTVERVEQNRKIRAAETELHRLTGLRSAMPEFSTTDADAVAASKRAAEAATKSREAECGTTEKQRGRNCRDREGDERAANDALRLATTAKAATDRANRLEADAEAQRRKLNELGPIVKVSVQGSAIASLFRLPDEEAGFLATAQQFGIAVVVDLIILMCVVSYEILGHNPSGRRGAVAEAEPAVVGGSKLPPPQRPTLATTRADAPAGPIHRIMTEALIPAKGQRVELGEAFMRYSELCRAEGRDPVTTDVYMDAMARFCKVAGIRTRIVGEKLYLLNVRLASRDGDESNSIRSGNRLSK